MIVKKDFIKQAIGVLVSIFVISQQSYLYILMLMICIFQALIMVYPNLFRCNFRVVHHLAG